MAYQSDLAKQGQTSDVWSKYCGFLDLSPDGFLFIQGRLLMEQMSLFAGCPLGKALLEDGVPKSVEEFRQVVPLTEYDDYEPCLSKRREDLLPDVPYLWAHTSGRSGTYKWVPYTRSAYNKLGQRIFAAIILSAARERGDVRIKEGDVLLHNTPARPYASGVALVSLAEIFPFRFVPPLEETETMSFQERVEASFEMALGTGIDVIGSITSVLVKIGERFAEEAGSTRLSSSLLNPSALLRLVKALLRSKLARRPLLPQDLWPVKGVMCAGTDTALYKDKIAYYWGAVPHEQYSATETVGTAAVQAWDKRGLFLFPDVVFWEFIPEEEWQSGREDPSYRPRTVLLDEVEPGQRYEVVITSFDGGPFLRYRMHDLVRFLSLRDERAGIDLPSMVFAGRSDGLIDLAGFTGLMDEPMVWEAIHETGILYEDWVMRKEVGEDGALLRLYIELKEDTPAGAVRQRVHEKLKALNPFYADLEAILDVRPLEVVLLPRGTFRAYLMEKQAAGADLAHMKPPHVSPSDEIIDDLMRLSRQCAQEGESA
jgi:hypothetical protein